MRNVIIIGDSTCDLPPAWREKLDVGFMPLPVNVGSEMRLDMYNVFPDEIFDYYKNTGTLCSTSAPNSMDYVDFWTKVRENNPDCDIVHFHISSEMTITYSAAKTASADFENVYPIDTRSVSIGVAQLMIEACRLRDEGKTGAEIYAEIEKLKSSVKVSFVVETLEFLHKGGRCTGLQAMGANLFNLHPAINMTDGKLQSGKKYRGNMKSVYRGLVTDFLSSANIANGRVFIANTSGDDERFESVSALIREIRPDVTEIICARPGCSICVHCGPGTVGLAFISED